MIPPFILEINKLETTPWWAKVIAAPDDNNKIVFNKGNSNASIDIKPAGGQWAPISIVGANAEWKKAQKIEIKKNTSLTTNKAKPKLIMCINYYFFSKKNNKP